MHTQSEHSVDGEHSAIEIHFVHQNAETQKYAVIGLLFDVVETGPNVKFFQTLQFAADGAQVLNYETLLATVDTTR